jgi:hypothetical protein
MTTDQLNDPELSRGNARVVIQENRVTVLITVGGATVVTTISRETGKVEIHG